jgi:hypothetical protein
MAFKLNGKTLPIDRGFTHNDINYPRNWLRLSTQEDKDALGITWEADPVRHDDRYYWNGELDNPKALEDVNAVDEEGVEVVTCGLKHTMINQVKHTAGTMLAQTDWYVVRKAEREVAIPADVVAERTHVVAESERLEVAIAACADVEALIEVMNNQSWGE